jgi:multidrug resistance efflux pump
MIRAPIATPPRHRWRAFCTGSLPAAVFLTVLAGIAALWRDSATAPTLVAEAEARRQEIGSDCDGRLTSLRVGLFQEVKAGDVLGHVTPAATAVARAAVAAQQSIPLVAPIDGVVATLARQEGEVVRPGLPILTISGARPFRLVGHLRQPLTFTPAPGHAVEVRTRGAERRFAGGTVLATGHVLEALPPTVLTLFNRVGAAELGLRVHFSVPAELALRPGELVDVRFTGAAGKR